MGYRSRILLVAAGEQQDVRLFFAPEQVTQESFPRASQKFDLLGQHRGQFALRLRLAISSWSPAATRRRLAQSKRDIRDQHCLMRVVFQVLRWSSAAQEAVERRR
jgi:hypothetical protein